MTPAEVIAWADKCWSRPNIVNLGTDTQAYHEETTEACVFSFGPTQTGMDVLTDILAWYRDGMHYGFTLAADSIYPEVRRRWEETKAPRVIFCGHSLGGALAQLFAAAYSGDKPMSCYTTGAPKPFRGKMAQNVQKHQGEKITNYQMPGDIVPHLPFWGDSVGKTILLSPWTWKDRLGLNLSHHLPGAYKFFEMVPDIIK